MAFNPNTQNNAIFHLFALFAAAVWGATFISTKVLLSHGMTSVEIMFYRFLMAYVLMFLYAPKIHLPKNWKDELAFIGLGICGGSLYFITENTALEYTLASNVSLLVCTAPLLTALLTRLCKKQERFSRTFIGGSCLALTGVALVVYNGSFVLQMHPLGDILTLIAALLWAFYTIILKSMDGKYTTAYITRKVFFYGVLTLLPAFWIVPLTRDAALFTNPVVISNLLFLGIGASLLCYILWNTAVKRLGSIRTSNYIYLIPLVTLFTSHLVLQEVITPIALSGAALILCGLYLAERGVPTFKLRKSCP